MNQQSATAVQKTQSALDDLFVPSQRIEEHMRSVSDLISRRAYELYENRGRVDGHDWQDWYQAESALLQPIANEVSDSGEAFKAVVDITAYRPQDLRISAMPQSLRICGCANDKNHEAEISGFAPTYLRAFSLSYQFPVPIDSAKASAEIRSGVLEVRAPKATSSTNVRRTDPDRQKDLETRPE
jgi:HSP20 family molecular chaperone IbpA